MKERKVDTLLLLIGSTLLLLPTLLCTVFLVQFFPVPEPPSKRICANLVEADLIKQEQCVSGRNYLSHYFPVGMVNSDYVTTGMKTFELVHFGGTTTCDIGGDYTLAIYVIATATTVSFTFCDDLLMDIEYSD